LIKNELVGLQPIDAKFAKAAMFPLQYPVVLGTSFGGTVTAIGDDIAGFSVGDKVTGKRLLWPWATSRSPSSNML
jgi:NADPH:quinone reductase-like Zn-dependent oxidoreductase